MNDWEFCNDFAFALFVQNGNEGLTEEEIIKSIKSKFNKKSKNSVVLLDADPRFREGTDGKYSVFPRVIKKFKKKDIPKSVLEEVFNRLEAGECIKREGYCRGVHRSALSVDQFGGPVLARSSI